MMILLDGSKRVTGTESSSLTTRPQSAAAKMPITPRRNIVTLNVSSLKGVNNVSDKLDYGGITHRVE